MIITTLKSKNTGKQAVLVAFLMVVMAVPAFLYGIPVHQPEDASALYLFVSDFLILLPGWANILIYMALVLWIAFNLADLGRFVSGERGKLMLPFFSGLLLLGAFPQGAGIHPPLVAMVFMVPAIKALLKSGSTQRPGLYLFNAGLFLSLASLVAFQLLLFVPVFFIALMVFGFFKGNLWGILLSGMTVPWAWYLVILWVADIHHEPDQWMLISIYLSNILYIFSFLSSSLTAGNYSVIFLLLVLMIMAVYQVFSKLGQQVIVTRQKFRTLLWLALPGLLVMAASGGMALQYVMVLNLFSVPVVAEFLGKTKRTRMVSLLLAVLILAIIAGHFHLF